MSYRGKKLKKQTQSLNKRNLVQEKAYTGIHNRGRGGRYRYLKRQEKKRMLKREEDRRRKAEELVRQADALMAEAGFFARWCPEEAERLIKQAELLRAKAEGVMTGKVIVKPERTGSEKTDPGKTSSEHFSSRRSYRPLYSFTMPEYKRDPQIEALADVIRSGERNFMNGISYTINPVDTLKMISASSVFGEPQYYRDGENARATVMDGRYGIDGLFTEYSLRMMDPYKGMKTSKVMEKAIDDALTADFEETLKWAVELRKRYLMRLNPQVIMVRAAMHPGRKAFTAQHPGEFAMISWQVMSRGDDVIAERQQERHSRHPEAGLGTAYKLHGRLYYGKILQYRYWSGGCRPHLSCERRTCGYPDAGRETPYAGRPKHLGEASRVRNGLAGYPERDPNAAYGASAQPARHLYRSAGS